MRARSTRPARDPAEHREDWRRLAVDTLAALADPGTPEFRRALGDRAALARNTWPYPASGPEGLVATPLAVGLLAWARQPSALLREQLAPGVKRFAEATLALIDLVAVHDAGGPPVGAPQGGFARRHRADIDG